MNLNGDGLVTPEELHAAGAPDEIVESVFALADADNGGNISLDELTNLQLVCSHVEELKSELGINATAHAPAEQLRAELLGQMEERAGLWSVARGLLGMWTTGLLY
jgi:hypothetical protein